MGPKRVALLEEGAAAFAKDPSTFLPDGRKVKVRTVHYTVTHYTGPYLQALQEPRWNIAVQDTVCTLSIFSGLYPLSLGFTIGFFVMCTTVRDLLSFVCWTRQHGKITELINPHMTGNGRW